MNNRKAVNIIILVALFFAIIGGCKNFMGGDDDFKETIEEEVRISNEPEFGVRIQAAANTGTTTPNGVHTVKQTVAFTVLFTPDKMFGFKQWAAFDNSITEEQWEQLSLE
ncbi:MAG: hypothetical protein LBQ57_10440, partial [Spirochaetales bacterium]|nr:hypothetical protein [Spirochaetales bacterium]